MASRASIESRHFPHQSPDTEALPKVYLEAASAVYHARGPARKPRNRKEMADRISSQSGWSPEEILAFFESREDRLLPICHSSPPDIHVAYKLFRSGLYKCPAHMWSSRGARLGWLPLRAELLTGTCFSPNGTGTSIRLRFPTAIEDADRNKPKIFGKKGIPGIPGPSNPLTPGILSQIPSGGFPGFPKNFQGFPEFPPNFPKYFGIPPGFLISGVPLKAQMLVFQAK